MTGYRDAFLFDGLVSGISDHISSAPVSATAAMLRNPAAVPSFAATRLESVVLSEAPTPDIVPTKPCPRLNLPVPIVRYAFAVVRDAVLGIGGGPLVSLAVATNVLAALTGSASGGLTIALDALGATYMARAAEIGLDPALLHRVAVIGSGTLDSLPHNGAVVTLLAVCGSTHRESYRDIVMVGIVGALVALAAVIALGSMVGSF